MNENGVRISYERLFNMGHFEHEKYMIGKDVEAETECEAWKKLSLEIVEFEEDLNSYRNVLGQLSTVRFDAEHQINVETKSKSIRLLAGMEKAIRDFQEKHKPVFRECKCYWCRNKDHLSKYHDVDYEDDESP